MSETPAEESPEAPEVAAEEPRAKRGAGCVKPLLIAAAVAVALFFIIGFIFDQGADAPQPEHGFNAGPAEAYQRGEVSQIESQHMFITRLQDGTFIALYDKSSRQQELGGDCRLHYDDLANLGNLPQLPGFTGGIVEDCEGQSRSVWRADGEFAFGAGYGHLDRFNTSTNGNGDLFVDIDQRTCTRSLGASGLPPFQERFCGRGE